jgi:aldose 1-epimerase
MGQKTNIAEFRKEWSIYYKGQELTICGLSGAIRRYRVDGQDVLMPFDKDSFPPASSGLPLFPWPNRIDGGKYEFDGVVYQLPISEPGNNNAIHGLTENYEWLLSELNQPLGIYGADDETAHLKISLPLPPSKGYPFVVSIAITYTLSDLGLKVESDVKNVGVTSAPVGLGFHPYLGTRGFDLKGLILSFNASTHIVTDERMIPVSKEPIEESDFDFREGNFVSDVKLDDAFCDLSFKRNNFSSGIASEVVLTAQDGSKTTFWACENFPVIQIYNGYGSPNQPGIAVEPMTCAANAFNTKENLRILEPKEGFVASWGVNFKTGPLE